MFEELFSTSEKYLQHEQVIISYCHDDIILQSMSFEVLLEFYLKYQLKSEHMSVH